MTVPSNQQIKAQVAAVIEHKHDAQVIAIRSPAAGAWDASMQVGDRAFVLRWCTTPLAVREALTESLSTESGLVLLTPLHETDLGNDVLARLARCRVFEPEGWEMVRQVFHAREVDARLAKRNWMAQALLDGTPPDGYPPAPSGVLDQDTAWRYVLWSQLGLRDARPDAKSLLVWSMQPDAALRYMQLGETARQQIGAWISECAGGVGSLIVRCLDAGNGADALPLGLVCEVVFAPTDVVQPELAAASVRLERFLGDQRIAADDGRRWAQAASSLVRDCQNDEVQRFLERADDLLRELHLQPFAQLSAVLPSGFEARLVTFAEALARHLSALSEMTLAELSAAALLVLAHRNGSTREASLVARRIERVQMAQRLAAWLCCRESATTDFVVLSRWYADQGAYVDWARLKLMGGDELAFLSAQYGSLLDAVRNRREVFSKRFALAMQAWNAHGAQGTETVLPLECVLDRVVAPLAQSTSGVLLIVADGLSLPIFRELSEDLHRNSWVEWVTAGADGAVSARVGVAALPTITETSRTSLLCGTLTTGNAGKEKSVFATHPALLAASKSSGRPVVFHKGDLSESAEAQGLAPLVRDAIADPTRRLVAIVYNAVDDHLSGSNQLHPRWTLDDLRLLTPILHEARNAGRVVVITADHGHVIDEKTVQRSGGTGDRWRAPEGKLAEDELLFDGGRVRLATGGNAMVASWSEQVRYSTKKNGYHGGIAPQEVLVPLAIYAPVRVQVPGYTQLPSPVPEWWDFAPRGEVAAISPPEPPRKKAKPAATVELSQPDFFAGDTLPAEDGFDWVNELLASSTYQQQKQLAARVAPKDSEVRHLLEALDARGGKLSKAAIAQRLGMPLIRISGFISAARRVLNVDQSPVLSLDEATGHVELNRELLVVQFQIKTR